MECLKLNYGIVSSVALAREEIEMKYLTFGHKCRLYGTQKFAGGKDQNKKKKIETP